MVNSQHLLFFHVCIRQMVIGIEIESLIQNKLVQIECVSPSYNT